MKIRGGFVSNSSSSSFIIKCQNAQKLANLKQLVDAYRLFDEDFEIVKELGDYSVTLWTPNWKSDGFLDLLGTGYIIKRLEEGAMDESETSD